MNISTTPDLKKSAHSDRLPRAATSTMELPLRILIIGTQGIREAAKHPVEEEVDVFGHAITLFLGFAQ